MSFFNHPFESDYLASIFGPKYGPQATKNSKTTITVRTFSVDTDGTVVAVYKHYVEEA